MITEINEQMIELARDITKHPPIRLSKKFSCSNCGAGFELDTLTYYSKAFADKKYRLLKYLSVLVKQEGQEDAHVCYDCQIEVLDYALKTAKEKREVEK